LQPEIDLFGLPLQTFGLSLGLAFLCSGAVASRRLAEIGRPPDWVYEMVFAALVGGIVGARVWWLAEHLDQVTEDPLGSLFSGSGLVFYGGALGGAVAVVGWALRKRVLGLWLLDLAAAPLAIGYAVGRIGCQLSGDGDYGVASDLPWAMAYPEGTVPTTVEVHPTPVYETLSMAVVTLGLWHLRDRVRPGGVLACWLVLAGVERFLVEFVRRNDEVVSGLTQPQLIAAAMTLGGLFWLWRLSRGGGVRVSPARPAAPTAPAARPA